MSAVASLMPRFTPQVHGEQSYSVPVGYLRAFVTVVVLVFHSVLAYYRDAPTPAPSLLAQPRWWAAFPVVDSHRWSGFTLFIAFNDIFFMSLMFFLSGLFVWKSVQRRGSRRFLWKRGIRLGVPFLIAAALAPVAYYPAYLQTPGAHTISGYLHQWFALGIWPAGPAWFVWVLLTFDCIAAALFSMAPNVGSALARLSSKAAEHPIRFFTLLLAATAAAYIPMALIFNPLQWTAFGPFSFQTSRIFLYLTYFIAGISVGKFGIDRGLLAPAGKLARRWWLWCLRSLAGFGIAMVTFLVAMSNNQRAPYMFGTLAACGFVLSCAASCFAFIAVFVRFARIPRRIFDSFRDNAYGMYLIHYFFVSWVQYAILRLVLPGFFKGCLASAAVIALSLATVAMLRRSRPVAEVI